MNVPDRLCLNGFWFPAADYAYVERITDTLYGLTPVEFSSKEAKRMATEIAIKAIAEIRSRTAEKPCSSSLIR